MIWEELPKDGALYTCNVTTSFEEQWRCRKSATKALTNEDFDRLRKTLPIAIFLHGRALCPTHQEMMERDYSAS